MDELEKISADIHQERRKKVKNWLKNSALMVAGAGAGSLVTSGLDKVLPHLTKVDPKMLKYVVGPLAGLSTVGLGILTKKMHDERAKRET